MATSGSASIAGFRELDATLVALGKSTGKNVLRRVGRQMLTPMLQTAQSLAPVLSGDLKADVKIGTVLAPSQRKASKGMRQDPKNSVTLYMGPGQLVQAITSEFGTFKQEAEPFMQPAFDQHADKAINIAGDLLWAEVSKAAARKAKRAAKG